MKLIKIIFLCFIGIIVIAAGCVFYAFKIEPYRLEVTTHALNEKNSGTSKINIVQISDLHVKEDFTYEQIDKVVRKVNDLNADIVLFTGDLYDNYAKYSDDEHIIAALKNIKATYGKIAIWGNRDYGGGAVRQYENIMSRSDFILLRNESYQVSFDSGKVIQFTGVDDAMLGNPYLPSSTKTADADYNILLTHEPDSVKEYMDEPYDAIFSGHSHGGQIDISFIPALHEKAVALTNLSTEYSGGLYTLDNQKKSILYVNTGIGTTHISARFGVVPEIAVFDIYLS